MATTKNTGNAWIFAGSIFLLAGLGIGFFGFNHVSLWFAARDWQPVPVNILSTDLKINRDDDSTSYKVIAEYSYQFKGLRYHNDRVWLGSGSDSIADFHQNTYNQLRTHLNGEPFTGYVNPADPNQSVLIRDFRWGYVGFASLFPLIFGGLGASILFMGIRSRKHRSRATNTTSLPHEQQWQASNNWHSNQLQSNTASSAWFIGFFALFWNLVSLPLWFILPDEILQEKNYPALLGLLFPLIGIGLIIMAMRLYRQWQKFGRSILIMNPFPANPGGVVKGELQLQNPLAAKQLQVRLNCINKVTSGSGDDRKTREHIQWQDEQVIRLYPGQQNYVIACRLPENTKTSDYSDNDNQTIWRLTCQAEVPGVDFNATFEVPVITGQPDKATLQLVETLRREEIRHGEKNFSWQETGVVHNHFDGYPNYHFPAGRNRKLGIILAVFGLVFGGIGIGLIQFASQWFIGSIFTIVGCLVLVGMLHSLLYTSQVNIKPGKVIVTAGMFFKKARVFPSNDVQSIAVKTGSSIGRTQYWNIEMTVATKAGTGYSGYQAKKTKRVQLATDLRSRRATEALTRRWKKEAGLK